MPHLRVHIAFEVALTSLCTVGSLVAEIGKLQCATPNGPLIPFIPASRAFLCEQFPPAANTF